MSDIPIQGRAEMTHIVSPQHVRHHYFSHPFMSIETSAGRNEWAKHDHMELAELLQQATLNLKRWNDDDWLFGRWEANAIAAKTGLDKI